MKQLKNIIEGMEKFLDQTRFAEGEFGDAFRISMKNNPLASLIWVADDQVFSEDFDSDEEMYDEAYDFLASYPSGACAVVPSSWHLYHQCDWIWIEQDKDGENCWAVTGSDGNTWLFSSMDLMWDKFLDYENCDWTQEAHRVLEYLKARNQFLNEK